MKFKIIKFIVIALLFLVNNIIFNKLGVEADPDINRILIFTLMAIYFSEERIK